MVGRIVAPPSDLDEAVEAWLAHLLAIGRAPRTIVTYRHVVRRAVASNGWSRVADVTRQAVVAYLASMRAAGAGAATYNHHLSVFQSFLGWLARESDTSNPLHGAQRATNADRGNGARAATTEEARAMIRSAQERARTDLRAATGNRAAYYLCMFGAGMRVDEPGNLLRRDISLGSGAPCVFWSGQTQKAKRQQRVVISLELAGVLREHLAQVDADRERAGEPPHDADSPVFPVSPARSTFSNDRQRLGIPHRDDRAQRFSSHSARKWFSTTLSQAGVSVALRDFLMRHTDGSASRYYDPPLSEQAAALALLPRLWGDQKNCADPSKISTFDLTRGGPVADDAPVTPCNSTTTTPPGQTLEASAPHGVTISERGPEGLTSQGRVVEAPEQTISGLLGANADYRPANVQAAAELLAALAKFLRGC